MKKFDPLDFPSKDRFCWWLCAQCAATAFSFWIAAWFNAQTF